MEYWIITDTHLGHESMIKYCDRPKNFTEKIISNVQKHVKDNDVLIHLGDIGWCDDWYKTFMYCTNAKKWLIKGNHDKKSDTWYLNSGWDVVCESMTIIRHGKKILFSHKPLLVTDDIDINIFGHFHNNPLSRVKEIEPELYNILTKDHKLISIEDVSYMPQKLSTIVRKN